MANQVFLGGRMIGVLDQDNRRFISHRRREHYFRIFDGFGLNSAFLEKLAAAGWVVRIIFEEKGETSIYDAPAALWVRAGRPYRFAEGDEEQVVLSLSEMRRLAGEGVKAVAQT